MPPLGTLVPGIPDPLVLAWIAGVGAIVGSFLNVVVYRLPARRSVVWPGSRCGFCESPIRWYDNVPVLSWVLLGGRCRRCGVRVSVRYALVEALTAAAFVLVVLRFGVGAPALVYAVFVSALIAVTFIDADHRIIPDSISKSGIVAGLLASALLAAIPATDHVPLLPVGPRLALAGAVLGYVSLLVAATAGRWLFGREAMGLGDVKVLAMIGAFLGPLSLAFVYAVAPVVGILFALVNTAVRGARFRGGSIPFGPFLAGAAVLYVLWGSDLMLAWLRASQLSR